VTPEMVNNLPVVRSVRVPYVSGMLPHRHIVLCVSEAYAGNEWIVWEVAQHPTEGWVACYGDYMATYAGGLECFNRRAAEHHAYAPAVLPAAINVNPNERIVTFAMFECRVCGERSTWERTDTDGSHHMWDTEHCDATERKHGKFYMFTLTRNTAQVFYM
jgi:hypothetical protein